MPKNTKSTSKSLESKFNSHFDEFAKSQKQKLENAEIKVNFMKCPPLFNQNGNSSNEVLGMVLNEVKEMRSEMKEIKKDVSMIKLEQENQKETLREMTKIKKILENVEGNQKRLQEDVTRNQKSLEEIREEQQSEKQLNQQKVNAQNEIQDEPNIQIDIRQQIYGKWRRVDPHHICLCTKFEGDIFMVKRGNRESYDKYRLGVEDEDGLTTSIENNKIVQRNFTDQGKEFWRREYYIENERLQDVCYGLGIVYSDEIYERIGDPESNYLTSIFFLFYKFLFHKSFS